MLSFTPDTTNALFQLAEELINQSNRNIFLTGKAGTGKTTFLKHIIQSCRKQMAIVAPTGVAAVNAGGMTIHSFFQLPLIPFYAESPGIERDGKTINKRDLVGRLRFNKDKRRMFEQMELLIIDEISMVRCDIMDAMDTVLRHVRRRPFERFGGVQVLLIGDLFQLPPVKDEKNWSLLSPYYTSNYFFDSKVMQEELPLYIEFEKIYRQRDEKFIRLLNQVRNNTLDDVGLSILEARFQPGFNRQAAEGYIMLTTHNSKAREINDGELNKLAGKRFSYKADIKNEFGENAYPAESTLELKTGAQVMFIRNDQEKSKRFFNGKIGEVTKLENDKIWVRCKDETEDIEVNKEIWENIRYSLNKETQLMEANVIGSFAQFPLRLAWAITIHKSQGLTFERAIIDARSSFTAGQVYVALSRCTGLEGMVLKTRIAGKNLSVEPAVLRFSEHCKTSQTIHQELEQAKKEYKFRILTSTFDIGTTQNIFNELREYHKENTGSFNDETGPWLSRLEGLINKISGQIALFHNWARIQFNLPVIPVENELLDKKIKDAALHFNGLINEVIDEMKNCPVQTDGTGHAREFNEGLGEMFTELVFKKFLMEGADGKLDAQAWHDKKKKFTPHPYHVNVYAGTARQKHDGPHPALYMQLKNLRDDICVQEQIPVYLVAGSNTLNEMCHYLPLTPDQLRQISGFGEAKTRKYGQVFLDVIIEYCREYGLQSRIHEKPAKRGKIKDKRIIKEGDTYSESFRLFKEGLSVMDIAESRGLTTGTIESHLARFVLRGDIGAEELISPDKHKAISEALKNYEGGSITPIKQELDDGISFGEIRIVMAALGLVPGNTKG